MKHKKGFCSVPYPTPADAMNEGLGSNRTRSTPAQASKSSVTSALRPARYWTMAVSPGSHRTDVP